MHSQDMHIKQLTTYRLEAESFFLKKLLEKKASEHTLSTNEFTAFVIESFYTSVLLREPSNLFDTSTRRHFKFVKTRSMDDAALFFQLADFSKKLDVGLETIVLLATENFALSEGLVSTELRAAIEDGTNIDLIKELSVKEIDTL